MCAFNLPIEYFSDYKYGPYWHNAMSTGVLLSSFPTGLPWPPMVTLGAENLLYSLANKSILIRGTQVTTGYIQINPPNTPSENDKSNVPTVFSCTG